ncbi:MAG: Rpn family recombination-promoting nuclease/putative transposase [Desulfovibrionaceae bacterium]|nr:Rpn family recombination-promoting nuclease/putative transposase [Desulfovibrionaceae bacterium]
MTRNKQESKKQNDEKQAEQTPQAEKEPKINACDASYRLYFSYSEVMEQFLIYFIPEKLRGRVNFATLSRYDSQNISRNWTDSREDLIWYAQTEKGVTRDLYSLLEFQSSVSQEMIFRFGQYTFIVYRALFDEKALKMTDGSTLLFPIVIYNGDTPWSAIRSMREIHDPREQDSDNGFQAQALFDYFVVDIGRLDPKLLEQDSLPGRLFRLERVKDENELIQTIKDIAASFRGEEGHRELARILCGWVKRIGLKRLKIDSTQFNAIYELEEFGTMLENVLPNWEAKVEKRAKEEARNERDREIAKNLLEIGIAIDKIMQATGMSQKDILALKTENANA